LARLFDERLPPERPLLERDAVERDEVERDPVERDAVERDPLERVPDARELDAREPEARDALERLVLREEPVVARELLRVERELEVLVFVTAWRSLSKSLSACLLVLAASRRRARSAAVTSL
jgi:hypothetical protein